jgi:hypothetical protein
LLERKIKQKTTKNTIKAAKNETFKTKNSKKENKNETKR